MKKLSLILSLLLLVPMFVVGCGQKDEKICNYYIDATYNADSQTLGCEQSVLYTNNTDNALGEICFFLYANSFCEVASSKAYFNKTYPNGEDFGKIEFESIYVNGQSTNYEISDGKNILSVTLSNKLFPQECVKIDLKYTVFWQMCVIDWATMMTQQILETFSLLYVSMKMGALSKMTLR